jgi:hypothetical protein
MRRVFAAATLALVAAGCGGGDASTSSIELVIPDNNIREEGIECAGARPFQHVHAGTRYTVAAPDGSVLVEGELPAGRARNADPTVDWGVERIPTICVMEFDVDLPERPRYRFQVEGSPPLEFDRRLAEEDGPLRLVVPG